MKMSLLGCLFVSCTSYPPESIQSHSDNPRHPPDTFQTPSRHPKIYHISTNPRQLGEKEQADRNESNWVFICFVHIIPPRQYPESIRQPQIPSRHLPDTFQTPSRHLPDTPKYIIFRPIPGNWEKRNRLIEMSLSGCLFVSCTSETVSRVTQTTPQHISDTFQPTFRHSKAPGREGTC